MRRILAIVFLLLSSLAQAQVANLWIDTNGGTCTRQTTAGAYIDAQACASIQAALSAASNGDTVRMKAGAYGSQSITATKASPGVTVIAESTTTIGTLTTGGAWYEIQNINGSSGSGWNISTGANNITCRSCAFTGGSAWVDVSTGGWSNISWIGGSMTNTVAPDGDPATVEIYGTSPAQGTNFLIEGVTFSNNSKGPAASNHFEVIRIDGKVNGVTIRKNTFTNNNVNSANIFLSTAQGHASGTGRFDGPTNLVIENNFFGANGEAFFHIGENYESSGLCQNFTIRYNTFVTDLPASFDECLPMSNVVWIGNLAPAGFGDCLPGTSFSNNVWYGTGGSSCGSGDSLVSTASVNFAADGFHIQTGSSAIDAGGSGANCISTDHDGNTRPAGVRCDAGAHEFGASSGGSVPSAPSNFRFTWLDWIYDTRRVNGTV